MKMSTIFRSFCHRTNHLKGNIILPKFSPLAPPEVVMLTISGATIYDNPVKIIFQFQWRVRGLTDQMMKWLVKLDNDQLCVAVDTDHSTGDRFVYVPSQWETTLHCNVVSPWLGAYSKCSLHNIIFHQSHYTVPRGNGLINHNVRYGHMKPISYQCHTIRHRQNVRYFV